MYLSRVFMSCSLSLFVTISGPFYPQRHIYYGYSQFQSGSLYTEVPSLSGPEAVPTIIE